MPFLVVLKVEDRADVKALLALPSEPVAVYRWRDEDKQTCSGSCGGDKAHTGWGSHPKYGWQQHACGARNPHWRKWFRAALFQYLGVNLLGREKTPAQFQNPEGWGK